ncbi:MAG: type II secretion system protein GspN [Bacteriovoracia bacterium]
MAAVSEIQSLEDISYKSRIKIYLWPLIILILFPLAFLNFYPVGDKLKTFLQTNLQKAGCNLDYKEVSLGFLLPKLIVTDLVIPSECMNRTGDPLIFGHITINFQFISFAPLGLPFRIDTQMNGQPVSFYFVQGFGERMIRMKDQSIVLSRLKPLTGDKVKLSGKVTVDLNALLTNNNQLKGLSLKAQSRDFVIPPQDIEGFTLPKMKVNEMYLEVNSDNPPQVVVEKLIIGDPDSPMRANFKGTIGLQQGNIAMSQVNLNGEVAFSESFKETVPVLDLFFNKFTQKDGFYQIRVGGILAQPKLSNP